MGLSFSFTASSSHRVSGSFVELLRVINDIGVVDLLCPILYRFTILPVVDGSIRPRRPVSNFLDFVRMRRLPSVEIAFGIGDEYHYTVSRARC